MPVMRLLSRSNDSRFAIGAGIAALCLASTIAGLTAAATPAPFADRAQAPALDRVETQLTADADAVVLGREIHVRDSLGFPAGKSRTARHVRDGFQNAEYDEVDEIDSDDRLTAIAQFDADGRLRAAIRFDAPKKGGRKLAAQDAVASARRSATAVGLTVDATASADANEATGGWSVRWQRVVEGVRVRGDETRVELWPNGQVWSVARVEHALAQRPSTILAAEQARQVARSNLTGWLARQNSSYDLQGLELEWVEPNDAFGTSEAADPASPYRLAWVALAETSGDISDYLYLVSLFIDAEDGTIIGGDLVE
jgi:hypothetical protein